MSLQTWVVSMLLLPSSSAFANCINYIDQAQEVWPGFGYGASTDWDAAQTFVVQAAGHLTAVELAMTTGYDDGTVLLDIRRTSGGAPLEDNATVLGSAAIPLTSLPDPRGWIVIDLAASNITVFPGDSLAIVLRIVNPTFLLAGWYGAVGAVGVSDPYVPGEAYTRDHPHTWVPMWTWVGPSWKRMDWAFRVYVCEEPVSTPSTSWGRLKARFGR